jgi:hypothetical protein
MARNRTTAKAGNKLAVKHGANAQPPAKRVRELEDGLYAALASAAPVRTNGELPAADEAAVRLCARTLARLESVSAWIDAHGALDRRGKPRSAALWERRLTATATKQLAALGMTPASRARIGVDVAQVADLATALSHPDPATRSRLLAEAGLDTPTGAGG